GSGTLPGQGDSMQPDFGPDDPGTTQGGPEATARLDQDAFAIALLRAATPQAVAAALAQRLPAAVVARAFWSPRWPEAVASGPPGASASAIARAVREVGAVRASRAADPRYLVLCDDPQDGTAVLRLQSPLPASASFDELCAIAGMRMA